jgi:phospholipid/cholesterol/gamma-HCH transport system substrate-binding protein
MTRRMTALVVLVIVVVAAGAAVVVRVGGRYQASVVLPAASNLVRGGSIEINGQNVGTIDDVRSEDGQALVTINVNDDYAPLRDGTSVRIRWKSLLGERVLELLPGADNNPPLPNGALIVGVVAPVEFEDVLATLDPVTRDRLSSLIKQTNITLDGRQHDLNETLQTAGPSLDALGRVLDRIGSDGPAISAVVTRLDQMVGTVATRRSDVSGVIEHLARSGTEVARRRAELREVLRELPTTLAETQRTLERVPAATDATVPLLHALAPATGRLPSIAHNLAPLLSDLRPAMADLGPTLRAAEDLLDVTPDLLDRAHAVLPPATDVVRGSQDAVAFLRPYSPEVMGFFTNWGSFSADVDGNAHYSRMFTPASASSFTNNNVGVLPPGLTIDRTPAPGSLEDQPWTDATGSGVR